MKGFSQFKIFIVITFVFMLFTGCVSIPSEAPELSAELGNRINAIENSNLALLHRFFDLKRAEIDQFIQNEWVPTFAKEIFSDSKMQNVWNTIVSEDNPNDRLRFLVTTGTKLQSRINEKRIELISPLDDIERHIEETIKNEYAQARAINNSITSFLFSASKVTENRDRYLKMIGVTDEKVSSAIDNVNDVVSNLLSSAKTAEENVKKAEDYLNRLREIKKSLM